MKKLIAHSFQKFFIFSFIFSFFFSPQGQYLAFILSGHFNIKDALATSAGDNILISEVEYDPTGEENEAEWFELYNPTGSSIDIGDWTVKEGATPTYTFPSPTVMASGDYLLVTNDTVKFQVEHPTIAPDLEMDAGGNGLLRLNNGGDELTLKNDGGTIVDYVAWEGYTSGWNEGAGPGKTVCRTTSTDSDTSAGWSVCNSPTPGSGSLTVIVTNDTPTDIKLDGGDADVVVENTATGTIVSVLTTIDTDVADTHTYSLISGAGDEDNTKFTITGSDLRLNFVPNFEVPTDLGDTVANNTYSIRLKTDDGNGGTYAEFFIITVTNVDDTPPLTPSSAPDLQPNSDTGSDDSDNNTTNTTPTLDIVCTEVGSTIAIYIDGASAQTHVCVGAGTESIILPSALSNGNHTVTYTETDTSSNESLASPTLNLTIDTIDPAIPSVTIDTTSNDVDNPILAFTSTDNIGIDHYTVAYILDDNAGGVLGSATTIDPATSGLAITLDPDELTSAPFYHTVTVTVYDAAGNSSLSVVKFSPIINFTTPTTLKNSEITDTTIGISTPSENDITNINISGAGSVGFTCTGNGGDTTAPYANPATCTGGAITSTGTLVVTAEDAINGAQGQNSTTFVIDTTNPTIAITAPTKLANTLITDTTISIMDDTQINVADVVISATNTTGAFAISNINCTQANSTQIDCTLQVDDAEGTGDIQVQATDTVGNILTQTENDYEIDKTAPSAPVCTTTPNPANNGTTVTTTCTGVETWAHISIPNMTCEAESGGQIVCTGIVGTGSGLVQTTDDNVSIVDMFGNAQSGVTTGLQIDNTAPVVTINSPADGDEVTEAIDVNITCAAAGDVITIANANIVPDPTTYSCTGTETAIIPVTFNTGLSGTTQALNITSTDVTGNISPTQSITLLIADGDNVSATTEDAAPNGGDGNNDGQPDSQQANVASFLNAENTQYNTLEVGGGTCTKITNLVSQQEQSLANQDLTNDYPIGLWEMTFECTAPGATAQVIIYLDQVYDTDTWIYKKYKAGIYTDISDIVTYGAATIGTQTVTTITYSVTDGGINDGDGIINGIINDPSGPAIPELDGKKPPKEDPDTSICTNNTNGDVKGYIWYDEDRDGNFDGKEDGIEDVEVELKDKNSNTIAHDKTNDDGQYEFQNIDAGEYTIVVDLGDNEIEDALQTYEKGNNRNGKVQFTHVCGKDYKKADFGFVYEDDIKNDNEKETIVPKIVSTSNITTISNVENNVNETPEAGTVTLKNLDGILGFRTGPGTNYTLITRISADTELTLLGVSENGDWYHVQTVKGTKGWVSAMYAQKNELVKEKENVPVQKETKKNSVVQQEHNINNTRCTSWTWFAWLLITIIIFMIIFLMQSFPLTIIATIIGIITWIVFDACRMHWWMPIILIVGTVVSWYKINKNAYNAQKTKK